MANNDVWDKFQFSTKKQKTALEYLNEFKEGLIEQTGGELRLDTEASDGYINSDPMVLAAIYKLYIVAPNLGEFRRIILTVAEYSEIGRFPVDIVNHYSNDKKLEKVKEKDFKKEIEDILASPFVKSSIENLYQQSKEYNKKK